MARGYASLDTIRDGRFLQMSARRGLAVVVILLNLNAAAGCVADLPTSALAPAAPSGSASAGWSPSALGADVTIAIMIAGGTVSPSGVDVGVRVGQRVQVKAISDVAESIHIHASDITLTLPPAVPGEVSFTADQVGVFEVHTEEGAKLIARLIVS